LLFEATSRTLTLPLCSGLRKQIFFLLKDDSFPEPESGLSKGGLLHCSLWDRLCHMPSQYIMLTFPSQKEQNMAHISNELIKVYEIKSLVNLNV